MDYEEHNFGEFVIILPKRKLTTLNHDSEYYGANSVLIRYSNLYPKENYSLKAIWQHGWLPDYTLVDPLVIPTSNKSEDKKQHFLVAKKIHEKILKKNNYKYVDTLGLPLIYTPQPEFNRIQNSLLVMPVHSLETIKHPVNFENYARLIHGLRKKFTMVVVCLHYSCIKDGYWLKEFEKYNIPWIEGANIYDENCLYRLRALFSQFEYMTTNSHGSHIPYAAYHDVKVSIYGAFADINPANHADEPYYKKFPQLLDSYLTLFTEDRYRKEFPQFFCPPWEATNHCSWAKRELGEENKWSVEQTRKLFVSTPKGSRKWSNPLSFLRKDIAGLKGLGSLFKAINRR